MKIATFNINSINSINRRLPNLLAWLHEAQPDVVCLQEIKTTNEAFPVSALRTEGYEAVRQGQGSWNGVTILAKETMPILTRQRLPGDPIDKQARYIEAAEKHAVNDPAWLLRIRDAGASSGDMATTTSFYRRATELQPSNPNAALTYSWGLVSDGHTAEAAAALKTALAQTSGDNAIRVGVEPVSA